MMVNVSYSYLHKVWYIGILFHFGLYCDYIIHLSQMYFVESIHLANAQFKSAKFGPESSR